MRLSFLQISFLIFLFLIFFYNKPFYNKQLSKFIITLIKNIKNHNSLRK